MTHLLFRSEIQGLPLTCGSIQVLNSRYAFLFMVSPTDRLIAVLHRFTAVYHVVGQLIVFVVSGHCSNVFSSLALLNAVIRIAVAETKVLDLPQDRVERKHAEVGVRGHVVSGHVTTYTRRREPSYQCRAI
jgi:hypothetical protein